SRQAEPTVCAENTQPGLILGAECCEGQQCVTTSSVGAEASMGLLSGDTLGPLAVALVIFLLLVDLMHRRARWAPRYPPGPLPLPGLGNLLHVDFQDLPRSFGRLRHCFGDVFSLQMAWTPVVVLNGLAAVREALVDHGEDTSDRPPVPVTTLLGVILAPYGHAWKEQRRFSVSTMRNLGLGKKSLEQWVTEEASYLCAAFSDQAGLPFSPNLLLNKAVSNVISSLIFGRRFEYTDPRYLKLMDLIQEAVNEDTGFLREVLNSIPVLLHIPGLAGTALQGQQAFMSMVDELVAENKMSRNQEQPPRDLTDAFLDEVQKAKGNPESSFSEENLRLVVFDLFSAGMVTTSITLAWALLLMILHPDVQRRVQEEIDEVIGQVRRPEMGDQARMPFTTAVVHEVQRFGDIIPLNLPHMTTKDIVVQGFLIPKGTTLITNLSSVLKDETVWEKPFRFHPEHFLDSQGRFVKQEAFMPFSAGRRLCLGEPLARMELFLFFTCLLQRFSFSVPPGQPRPSDHGVYSFLVTPSPYQLVSCGESCQCTQRSSVGTEASMGLLSGDTLGPLAVALAVFLLLVDLMHRRTRWAPRYPPGPLPLPGLGNLLQVDFQELPQCISQLRHRFGDVFSLQMAWTPMVVLNGLAAVREALVDRGEDTADRPPMPLTELLGVILARYGHVWREQRRFSVSTMRNLGLGKKSLEQWVTEEASYLCAAFADHLGLPFSPNLLLNKAVSNVIAALTFGRRFEYEDPRFLKLLDLSEDVMKDGRGFLHQVMNMCPVLRHIPGLAGKVFQGQKAFIHLVDELVAENRITRDQEQPPRDLTDAFLDEVQKAKGNPESSFSEENLRLVVSDLFFAGMVTTSITLAWALLLMILHPDVQRRVQEEIDEVIGQVRRPEMGDQARMPFTTAVVHEVQRFGDIIPLNLPHMTTKDIVVQGFLIPKGTTFITNLSSVLKDETVWEKPFRFHPEHFLDAQGRFVKQEAFMPFSAGVIMARYGRAWKEQRRFSVSTMRNLGLGKKSLEQWVTEEASYLCAAFSNQAGLPFSPNLFLNKAVTNVLNSIPMLLHIPGLADKVLSAQKALMSLVDELVAENRNTRDQEQPPRDLTDAFLDEVQKAKGNPESSFSEENLRLVVFDLFSAGMVTTSITLAWALLLMILHPDVQRRVQEEIDEVIGQVRRPEMGDQARMPFTTAVVHEVQRFGDIIPLNVPHMTTKDIVVQGFLIPKGTTLITNLSSVLKDETIWEKPFRFHPEHFLDAQGRFVKQEAFMPFSAGRRLCLGEPLARMELFLVFTCLLQRFSFSVPPGQPRPSDHGVHSFLVTPSPYQLCAVPR
ncbi:hypothetical protein MC885_014456, partial [Smutsia gigantea]